MYTKRLPLGDVQANCYIICDEETKIGAVIDPGDYNSALLKEIENFFSNYKILQGITVKVGHYHNKCEALKIIEECKKAYTAK